MIVLYRAGVVKKWLRASKRKGGKVESDQVDLKHILFILHLELYTI